MLELSMSEIPRFSGCLVYAAPRSNCSVDNHGQRHGSYSPLHSRRPLFESKATADTAPTSEIMSGGPGLTPGITWRDTRNVEFVFIRLVNTLGASDPHSLS